MQESNNNDEEQQYAINELSDLSWNYSDIRTDKDDFIPEEFYHLGIVSCWEKTKGEGAVLGLFGTGIDLDHPEINHHIVGSEDFVNLGGSGQDDNGFGTTVASRIHASINKTPPVGIAPLCSIYNLKVLTSTGSGTSEGMIRGFDACLRKKVDIILYPISGGSYSPIIHDLLKECVNAGILVVGAYPTSDNAVRYEEILYVGGHYSDYYNAECDLIAPTFNLYTAELGSSTPRFRSIWHWEIVAGIALLVKAYHPDWGGTQIKEHLIKKANWIPNFKAPMVTAVNILE